MAQTVVGMFDNSSDAQQAIQKLVSAGISRDQIDLSSNTNNSGSSYSSSTDNRDDDHESGISKFFKDLFSSDDDDDNADKYAHVAKHAECIVTVHTQSKDESEKAADILDDNGAVNVDERASEFGYSAGNRSTGINSSSNSFGDRSNTVGAFDTGTSAGLTGTASTPDSFSDTKNTVGVRSTTDFTENDRTATDDTSKIPIIEENLEVGKREVQSGGVRVRSRIVERPVEESVRLREERVNVERNKVDRPATEADFKNFGEKDIEMVEHTEVPVVNKQARVVEEVSLNKDVNERSETINETVRKTEVDVTDLDKDDLKDRSKNDF
ncbi:MAG: YsnF/AvaK domain-containing protein [Bacteroidota bacterium]|nr:YsnF/AvaK domain-containing protein [Bacteroidota bacterium]